MLFTLGIMLAFLMLGAWLLKRVFNNRMMQVNKSSAIKVLERRNLAPKSAIYLVEICGQGLVIGETPAGLTRLGEIDGQLLERALETESTEKKNEGAFSSILKKTAKKELATR